MDLNEFIDPETNRSVFGFNTGGLPCPFELFARKVDADGGPGGEQLRVWGRREGFHSLTTRDVMTIAEQKYDTKISQATLQKHRRRDCRCFPNPNQES